MVPFEYEKKEPSEWFRRGASPGRNIGTYTGCLLEMRQLDYLADIWLLETQVIYPNDNFFKKR